MKPINFLQTLNHTEQRKVRRWAQLSLGTGTMLFVIIITLQSIQVHEAYTAYQSHAAMQQHINTAHLAINTQVDAQQNNDTLRAKHAKLTKLIHALEQPQACLQELNTINSTAFTLRTIKFDKKDIEIQAACPSIQEALDAVEYFKESMHFKDMKLVSLQTHNEHVMIHMRGLVKN